MKLPQVLMLVLLLCFVKFTAAQKASKQPLKTQQTAIVVDETLSVLRTQPGFFADHEQRMRRGRKVTVLGEKKADGVTFFRVAAPPNRNGWVQAEAVAGRFRKGDDERVAKLIQAVDGFDKIELAMEFENIFPDSSLRPLILLQIGDLIEDTAAKLTREATRKLDRAEMAASGAPIHSYYLNFVGLDRYRRLGIVFLFHPEKREFHYEGNAWRKILKEHPNSEQAATAQQRLEKLKNIMKASEKTTAASK